MNISNPQKTEIGYNTTLKNLNSNEGTNPISTIKYKECMKNHAAPIGGNATDGCGEFIASNSESLTCSACNCHRNFHRKEIQFNDIDYYYHPNNYLNNLLIMGGTTNNYNTQERFMRKGSVNSESGDEDKIVAVRKKKRFRTKFTQQQKEKLVVFAEKAGWKMQKLQDCAVHDFCEEIGIKRRVLKVWMHNNKHHFNKKLEPSLTT